MLSNIHSSLFFIFILIELILGLVPQKEYPVETLGTQTVEDTWRRVMQKDLCATVAEAVQRIGLRFLQAIT